jgi:hypothetical protein
VDQRCKPEKVSATPMKARTVKMAILSKRCIGA